MRICAGAESDRPTERLREARVALNRAVSRSLPPACEVRAVGGQELPLPKPGVVHEWFAPAESEGAGRSRGKPFGFPVLALPLLLAWQSMPKGTDLCRFLFVGPNWFLSLSAFERSPLKSVLARAVFVDPVSANDRALAFDLALRCPSTTAVIADGRGVDMSLSRRFQLAAGAGNTLGVLLRPPHELSELSAAATRWLASPTPSPDDEPRWSVELLRCKGLRPTTDARRWTVRLDYETGDVRVVADAGDRPGSTERSASTTTKRATERATEERTGRRTA